MPGDGTSFRTLQAERALHLAPVHQLEVLPCAHGGRGLAIGARVVQHHHQAIGKRRDAPRAATPSAPFGLDEEATVDYGAGPLAAGRPGRLTAPRPRRLECGRCRKGA